MAKKKIVGVTKDGKMVEVDQQYLDWLLEKGIFIINKDKEEALNKEYIEELNKKLDEEEADAAAMMQVDDDVIGAEKDTATLEKDPINEYLIHDPPESVSPIPSSVADDLFNDNKYGYDVSRLQEIKILGVSSDVDSWFVVEFDDGKKATIYSSSSIIKEGDKFYLESEEMENFVMDAEEVARDKHIETARGKKDSINKSVLSVFSKEEKEKINNFEFFIDDEEKELRVGSKLKVLSDEESEAGGWSTVSISRVLPNGDVCIDMDDFEQGVLVISPDRLRIDDLDQIHMHCNDFEVAVSEEEWIEHNPKYVNKATFLIPLEKEISEKVIDKNIKEVLKESSAVEAEILARAVGGKNGNDVDELDKRYSEDQKKMLSKANVVSNIGVIKNEGILVKERKTNKEVMSILNMQNKDWKKLPKDLQLILMNCVADDEVTKRYQYFLAEVKVDKDFDIGSLSDTSKKEIISKILAKGGDGKADGDEMFFRRVAEVNVLSSKGNMPKDFSSFSGLGEWIQIDKIKTTFYPSASDFGVRAFSGDTKILLIEYNGFYYPVDDSISSLISALKAQGASRVKASVVLSIPKLDKFNISSKAEGFVITKRGMTDKICTKSDLKIAQEVILGTTKYIPNDGHAWGTNSVDNNRLNAWFSMFDDFNTSMNNKKEKNYTDLKYMRQDEYQLDVVNTKVLEKVKNEMNSYHSVGTIWRGLTLPVSDIQKIESGQLKQFKANGVSAFSSLQDVAATFAEGLTGSVSFIPKEPVIFEMEGDSCASYLKRSINIQKNDLGGRSDLIEGFLGVDKLGNTKVSYEKTESVMATAARKMAEDYALHNNIKWKFGDYNEKVFSYVKGVFSRAYPDEINTFIEGYQVVSFNRRFLDYISRGDPDAARLPDDVFVVKVKPIYKEVVK